MIGIHVQVKKLHWNYKSIKMDKKMVHVVTRMFLDNLIITKQIRKTSKLPNFLIALHLIFGIL